MANFYDFSSGNINIFIFIIDKSGSMEDDTSNVRKGVKGFIKSFDDFSEAGSIAVSLSQFNENFYPEDFKRIDDLKIEYSTYGGTALYYSIVKGAEHLNKYVREVIEKRKSKPKVTFLLLSDGEPCHDRMDIDDAKKAIENLNYAGVTTIFVPFGKAISSNFGKKLGFTVTREIDDREDLVEFFEEELSQSCKNQSMSYKALGANFFSKALDGSNSEGYSQTTSQALEDDSWIEDL